MTALIYEELLAQASTLNVEEQLRLAADILERARRAVAAQDITTARRKVNRWLLENVGNMLRADQPYFLSTPSGNIWRFGVYVTAVSHDPIGPVGYVDVDATGGDVLADAQTAEEIATRGETLECIPLPADR